MANRRGMVTGAKLERIGEAIRDVLGTNIDYKLDDMPDAIRKAGEGGTGGGGDVYIGNLTIGNAKNALLIDIIEN